MADRFIRLPQEEALREEQLASITEAEWPETRKQLDQQDAAAQENSFSGELRRAIRNSHKSGLTQPRLLREAKLTGEELGQFLRGEGELSSSAIDRLVKVLGGSMSFARGEESSTQR